MNACTTVVQQVVKNYVVKVETPINVVKPQSGLVEISPANLAYTAGAANGVVSNSNGTGFTVPLADASLAGLLAPAEKTKLASIATGATANSADATLLARANHTGTQAISTVDGLQTALDAKQATLPVGTTSQYLRGDGTLATLDKAAVGLGNVDNTADLAKPVSTATATALATQKQQLTSLIWSMGVIG